MSVNVTLTMQDNLGCISQTSTPLNVNPNTLEGGLVADPIACYGSPRRIYYSYQSIPPITTPVYHWYETNQTTSIPENNFYETGSYYVRVTDNNGCATQSDWINIGFNPVPVAEIAGDAEYCPDGTIKLLGNSGDNTYLWTGLGPYSYTTPNISVGASGLNAGNYTVTLTVSKNGCNSTDTKAITIHSAPATPSIGFGANICLHIPPVDLISTASQNLHWSTGDYGAYTHTYNAGYHTAYYTDPITGCRSANAEIDVPKPPDFNELMTGCFEFCKQDLPRYVIGPCGEFDYWKWYYGNSVLLGSPGSITQLLKVPDFGTYHLEVGYGGFACITNSEDLVVSQKETCDSCDIEISLLKDAWCDVKDCKLRVFFYLNIYNPTINSATLYSVSSPNIGTLYTPALPVTINPGTTSALLFEIELANYEPQDMYLQLLFRDGNGNMCYSHFFVDLSDVLDECIETECFVEVDYFKYLVEISTSGMAYFRYFFTTSTGMSNVQLYSDDVTIIDVNYNATTGDLSGLLSITPLELRQLIDSSRDICFRMYACNNGNICKKEFCVPAYMLRIIGSKSVAAEDDSDAETGSAPDMDEHFATDFCLYPNPATSIVSISGDNFSHATVIDTGGKVVMEVYDTTFNIGMLRTGEYIVKAISLDGDIQYLKLVKR